MALFKNIVRETVEFGGKPLTLETGRLAKQAAGAVLVTHGETVVLATVTTTHAPRGGLDYFPLVVDLIEKTYAAGILPGGFFKREGRPTELSVLTSRLIDRPLRPLFPDGYNHEVQVICTVLSVDKECDPNLCGLIGASAALHISDIPWNGPIAGCVVGRVDGQLVACPTPTQLAESDMDLLVAARSDGIVMVEGSAGESSEDDVVAALQFGVEAMAPIFGAIGSLREQAGKPKYEWTATPKDEAFIGRVREIARPMVAEAAFIPEKMPRYAAMGAIPGRVAEALGGDDAARTGEMRDVVSQLKYEIVRERILAEGKRIDGRGLTEVREIVTEVGVLPRTHGSALFTRGETQSLATVTFGTRRDEQRIDSLLGSYKERFLLHYNFPPFSVGEVKMLRNPSRRDIGHGNLARRGVLPIVPPVEDFPYTIRVVSEILESNGSSSMATVCASSMAMMQAGVPVKAPVAGIAMGLVSDGERTAVLTDILGDEDHLGDMDFKVVGTASGITALQMDIKIESLQWDVLRKALAQAREGRVHILGEMAKTISEPADDLSDYAPRIFSLSISVDKIRDLIGPGGKHIRGIVDATGVDIDVQDDGRVAVAAMDGESAARAIELIHGYTEEPEIGKVYLGTVAKITDFGAFVTIQPGTDGLCHISELADERVRAVSDIAREGDEMLVKVLAIDRQGKIKLSRREALEDARQNGGE